MKIKNTAIWEGLAPPIQIEKKVSAMELPKRKSMRLLDYDYSSPGAYFITICTKNRSCILSTITVGADALGGPIASPV